MSTTDHGPGKHPRTRLAGPYGHPFHPVLVTVPIGAWVASIVFDLASRMQDDGSALALGSQWLIAIGVIGALAAALFGLHDLSVVPSGTAAYRSGVIHLVLNVVVIILYAVNFGIRVGQDDGQVGDAPLVLSVIALVLLGVSGWIGGKLVYTYGVRVADESTQSKGFR